MTFAIRVAVLLLAVVALASPVPVAADIRDDEGPVFYGTTREPPDPDNPNDRGIRDPITVFFRGGSHPLEAECPASGCFDPNGNPNYTTIICDTVTHEVPACVRHVLRDHGRIRANCAPGHQSAILRSESSSFVPEGASLSLGTRGLAFGGCGTQLHLRVFSDRAHGHPLNQAEWMIASPHIERLRGCRIRSGFRPTCDGAGHRISRSWEFAERRTIDRVATKRDPPPPDPDLPGHCYYRDVLRVPGSGSTRGWFSDGRASRISMKHKDESKPRAEQCIGG